MELHGQRLQQGRRHDECAAAAGTDKVNARAFARNSNTPPRTRQARVPNINLHRSEQHPGTRMLKHLKLQRPRPPQPAPAEMQEGARSDDHGHPPQHHADSHPSRGRRPGIHLLKPNRRGQIWTWARVPPNHHACCNQQRRCTLSTQASPARRKTGRRRTPRPAADHPTGRRAIGPPPNAPRHRLTARAAKAPPPRPAAAAAPRERRRRAGFRGRRPGVPAPAERRLLCSGAQRGARSLRETSAAATAAGSSGDGGEDGWKEPRRLGFPGRPRVARSRATRVPFFN